MTAVVMPMVPMPVPVAPVVPAVKSMSFGAGLLLACGATLLVAACQTAPPRNTALDTARRALAGAKADPEVASGASIELRRAESEFARAERAWEERRDEAETRHLAYLARQRAAIATNAGLQQAAESKLQQAGTERARLSADAVRGRAIEVARPVALPPVTAASTAAPVILTPAPTPAPVLQAQAQPSASPSPSPSPSASASVPASAPASAPALPTAQTQPQIPAPPATASPPAANGRGGQFIAPTPQGAAATGTPADTPRTSQFIAPAPAPARSVQPAPAQRDRDEALQRQLAQIDPRDTARGLVVTLPDVLFDLGGSRLKPGGRRTLEQLVGVMQRFPERRVLLEGFTDNIGPQFINYDLSQRRAEALRTALLAVGGDARRIDISAQGPFFPVASNST
ncbi:OmpA family protein, partial [Methylibium sp.]|uniref:OmpA family protein n=1 Tax=Methylibium sp. TaxID=2067992 RepID=UPI00286B5B80